jgi:hypothetical protein
MNIRVDELDGGALFGLLGVQVERGALRIQLHSPPSAAGSGRIGDMDGAIEYAQQACDEREPGLVIMTRSRAPTCEARQSD